MNTKGLFYIPEKNEEIKTLVNDIIKRHNGAEAMDMLYAVTLTQELFEREIAALEDDISFLRQQKEK